jgi:hypothetical protein
VVGNVCARNFASIPGRSASESENAHRRIQTHRDADRPTTSTENIGTCRICRYPRKVLGYLHILHVPMFSVDVVGRSASLCVCMRLCAFSDSEALRPGIEAKLRAHTFPTTSPPNPATPNSYLFESIHPSDSLRFPEIPLAGPCQNGAYVPC